RRGGGAAWGTGRVGAGVAGAAWRYVSCSAARSVDSARSRSPRRTTSTLLRSRNLAFSDLTSRSSSTGSVMLDLAFDFIPFRYLAAKRATSARAPTSVDDWSRAGLLECRDGLEGGPWRLARGGGGT